MARVCMSSPLLLYACVKRCRLCSVCAKYVETACQALRSEMLAAQERPTGIRMMKPFASRTGFQGLTRG